VTTSLPPLGAPDVSVPGTPSLRPGINPWVPFLLRRVGSFALSLWVIVTLVFFMARSLSGDAVVASAGLDATPEFLATKRAELGLDAPLIEQYGDFLRRLPTLNFGDSIALRANPLEVIAERIPFTIQLGLLAFALSVLIAVPLGMSVAARAQGPGRSNSSIFNAVTGFVVAIPDFLLAVGLISLFAITLKILPPAGGDGADAFVLPVITLSVGLTATLSRLVATETSRVLKEDYVRTARSLRLPSATLYYRHVLPNVLTAVLTSAGLILASLLGGTLITETVFAWPGIGALTIDSILQRDYPMLQSVVAVVAAISLLVTLLVDLLVAKLDPRSLILRS
jgi:peptide/nickel transport system permease protein